MPQIEMRPAAKSANPKSSERLPVCARITRWPVFVALRTGLRRARVRLVVFFKSLPPVSIIDDKITKARLSREAAALL